MFRPLISSSVKLEEVQGASNTAAKTTHKCRLLYQDLLQWTVPDLGAFLDVDPTQEIGWRWGRAGRLFLPHQQVGGGSVLVPIKLPGFLPPDNSSDRPPGRGHQGHHPRGEPGPGIPGHRFPCQGGWCGVQPFGGRLHPCRTVSGSHLKHGQAR